MEQAESVSAEIRYTDAQFVDAYFGWRQRADEAFAKGDGAVCVGAAARADKVAGMFRAQKGLRSRDEAVALLRRIREGAPYRHRPVMQAWGLDN